MRTAVALLVLCCLSAPALAHDAEYGLRHCYSGTHCPQDTLVFGVVTDVSPKTYTVIVRKVLRSKGDVVAGMRVRLVTPERQRPSWLYQEPAVNGGILVSFLKKGRAPYRPHYQVRSTTTDWRKMTVDTHNRNDFVENIERLVRSGGMAYGFYGANDHRYFITADGRMERLERAVELGTPPSKPPAASRAHRGRAYVRHTPADRGAVHQATVKEARRPAAARADAPSAPAKRPPETASEAPR